MPPIGATLRLVCVAFIAWSTGVAAQESRPTSARLSGVVRDTAGIALRGVIVRIGGTERRTESDSAGRFQFAGAPLTRLVLHARRLGFRPESVVVAPRAPGASDPSREVVIRLEPIIPVLDAVDVVARDEVYRERLAGFERRRQLKVGHFVGREELEQRNLTYLADVLRTVPGVRVGALNGLQHAVRIRGARCPPLVWIDGFPAHADEVDFDMIDPASVEGIEIYASQSSVPQEFMATAGELQCGVIVIWSRPARPREKR